MEENLGEVRWQSDAAFAALATGRSSQTPASRVGRSWMSKRKHVPQPVCSTSLTLSHDDRLSSVRARTRVRRFLSCGEVSSPMMEWRAKRCNAPPPIIRKLIERRACVGRVDVEDCIQRRRTVGACTPEGRTHITYLCTVERHDDEREGGRSEVRWAARARPREDISWLHVAAA